jgi:hypothetical protein
MRLQRYRANLILGALTGGSSRPLLAQTDGGRFVVKLVGGPEGPRALAAEWLCTALAGAIGLPTLELAMIELDPVLARSIVDSELREEVERGAGACLGLRELPGARPARLADLGAAPDDFALPILWLDILIQNPDRRTSNPNVLAWGSSLVPIDHGSCLPFHHEWKVTEQSRGRDLEVPVDHIFAERADRLGAWHSRLRRRIRRDALSEICRLVPREWLGQVVFSTENRQRQAYGAYLWKRLRAMDAL